MKEILERLEQKMDTGLGRLEQKMDAGLERLEKKMDSGFARVDGQLQKQGVLLEALTGDVKMALEGISGNREVLDVKFAEVLEKLDERIQPVELATRHLAAKTTKPR